METHPYTEDYYRGHCSKNNIPYDRFQAEFIEFFKNIAVNVKSTLFPKTVFEFGCAKGFLVEAFRDLGIEAEGIDISEHAIHEVREDIKPFCWAGSILEPLPQKKHYDVVVCIEVLEHLTEAEGKKAIENICKYSDMVLFSSTPDDFDEPTHINVQPKEYWIELFRQNNFNLDELYNASYICEHAMLFKKLDKRDRSTQTPNVLCIIEHFMASTHIRLLSPLALLDKENRLKFRFIKTGQKNQQKYYKKYIDWSDIIVFQRTKDKRFLKLLYDAKKSNKICIYEIDDNLLELPPEHTQYERKIIKRMKHKMRHIRYIKHADAVTVATKTLAEYCMRYNKNVHVLPNYLYADFFTNKTGADQPVENTITIGYLGTSTHRPDFETVVPALINILKEFHDRARLVFIGYVPDELQKHPSVSFIASRGDNVEGVKIMASTHMDFALAPLNNNFFNRCKSNIKFLEYSLCGIPGIYSDVTPYSESVKHHETGILIRSQMPDEWYHAMKTLIEDEELRRKIRRNAFMEIRRKYMLRDHYSEWHDLYMKLLHKT